MIELAAIAIDAECCGVVPADPVVLAISGTLDIEFGDSIMVLTPPVTAALLLLRETSPEHPAEF